MSCDNVVESSKENDGIKNYLWSPDVRGGRIFPLLQKYFSAKNSQKSTLVKARHNLIVKILPFTRIIEEEWRR